MIKNLSEIRRLSRVGKIHLGIKATARSGSEYPKAVDYFVVKTDESTPASAAEAFKKVYGEAPKELEVMFPVNAVNIFWDCFYKSYVRTATTGGKLICKGDGMTANRLNIENGEFMEIQCPGPEDCEYAQGDPGKPLKCKRVGTLQFLLPSVGILGVWQIDTGSFNGIVGINSDIDMIRSVTGGRIAMIPLILKVVPKKCNVEGKQSIIHHLRVEYRGTIQTLTALSEKLNKQRQLSYDIAPVNPDEIPADLMPPATLPLIGQDAPADGKPAAAAPAAAPAPQKAPAPAAPPPPQKQPERHQALNEMEIMLSMKKGMSLEAAQALKNGFPTADAWMTHLKSLPDVAPAAPTDINADISAEFARLNWPKAKQDTLLKAFAKDKPRLLKTLKEAK